MKSEMSYVNLQFKYRARTQDGVLQTGTVEASNENSAIETLRSHNLTIISLETAGRGSFLYARLTFLERVKDKELALFSRQLAALFEVGTSPVEALKIISEDIENSFLKDTVLEMMGDIEGGASFSDVFKKHPKVFSDFYVSMIKSAEVSGRLQEVLMFLVDHLENRNRLRRKIKGALLYPAIIFIVAIVVGVVLFIFVVPQMLEIFKEVEADLPITTRALIVISEGLRQWWWLLILAIFGLGVSFWYYIKIPEGRRWWDGLVLKIPVFGQMIVQLNIFRLASNLGTLIASGIPIIQALNITADTLSNTVFKDITKKAAGEVEKGNPMADTFREEENFPSLAFQMVKVGESSGKLDSILESLASFYEEEVNDRTSNLTGLIEPFLIIFLGAVVGFLVSAILLPIYSLVGSL